MVTVQEYIGKIISPGTIDQFLAWFTWGFLTLALVATVGIIIRNKLKYQYYGEVIKRRQSNWQDGEPDGKIIRGKAGYFNQKGKRVFRIKHGWKPWEMMTLRSLPDPAFMQDNTAYFIQFNEGEVVQAQRIIDWTSGTDRIIPVSNTTKAGAKEELRSYGKIFTKQSKLQENMGIAIMGFILISAIISLYFVQKACGG